MNICLLGAHLPPIIGGIESHMMWLGRWLRKSGHNVFIVGHTPPPPFNAPKKESILGVEIHRVGYSKPFRKFTRAINLIKKILELNKKRRIDIIHCHYLYPTAIVGTILNCITGIPIIVTEHGSIINDRKIWLRRAIIKVISAKIKTIITKSRELMELCISVGIPKRKLVFLPNAVDTDFFNPTMDGNLIRRKYKIPKDNLVVLFLRRIVPKTGLQYLIRSARQVVREHDNIKFLLVGGSLDKSFQQAMINEISKSGLDRYFIFAGAVPNQEVPQYISACNFAVFPSLAEATSIACLEVMACGKPVISTNVGGLTEIIRHERNGLIVDAGSQASSYQDHGLPERFVDELADAIIKLIKRKDLREKMGRQAREDVVMNYSWSSYVNKILNIYVEARA